jgi:glycosyltransferase involved in cell wall biosynthesis
VGNGISAVLITKNEEKVIGRCLKSLLGLDEIVVLDTGSTDKTVKIATDVGAKVFTRTPAIVPFHFALARNEATLLAKNDWIFTIDADEVLRPGGTRKMRRVVEEAGDLTAFAPTFINQAEGDGSRTVVIQKTKLFRTSEWEWKYRVHEQLVTRKPGEKKIGDLSAVSIEHLPNPDKSVRHGQNLELLKMVVEENPEYARAFRHLGQELMLRKEWVQAIPYLAQYAEKTEEGPLHKSEVLSHIGRCYVETARLDEALPWFDQASLADPRRREPLYHAALGLIKACRLEEALLWVKRMLAIPVTAKPGSHLDLPEVWAGMPVKMLAFCTSEIARAKAAYEAQKA